MMPLRDLILALSRNETLRRMAVRMRPARAVARRFVAGERLQDAVAAVQSLNEQGLMGTLAYLGENVASEMEARDAATEILDLLGTIQAEDLGSGVSIKLTQLGLELSPALAADSLERIVSRAGIAQRFVRIDMEGHEHVPTTLELFEDLWGRYRHVGVVIQAYLHRSAEDVTRLVGMGASVRLVKGAYDEPPDVAFAHKPDTDASFVRLAKCLFSERAVANGVFPAIATHDAKLINWTKAHVRERGIAPDRFEFQMLYGIRAGLQRQLIADGYRVRAYVPYGEQWYPYLMRRLAERPANLLFLLRNLFRP